MAQPTLKERIERAAVQIIAAKTANHMFDMSIDEHVEHALKCAEALVAEVNRRKYVR